MATTEEHRHAVSRLAGQLVNGYYAFVVAQYVAVNPVSVNALPPAGELGRNPTGQLPRKDGTFRVVDLRLYLDLLREDFGLQTPYSPRLGDGRAPDTCRRT